MDVQYPVPHRYFLMDYTQMYFSAPEDFTVQDHAVQEYVMPDDTPERLDSNGVSFVTLSNEVRLIFSCSKAMRKLSSMP